MKYENKRRISPPLLSRKAAHFRSRSLAAPGKRSPGSRRGMSLQMPLSSLIQAGSPKVCLVPLDLGCCSLAEKENENRDGVAGISCGGVFFGVR
jgi:hypothetical protein